MTAPKPVVTPGPDPRGPPGWEEKQQKRMSSGELTNEKQSRGFHDNTIPNEQEQVVAKDVSQPKSGLEKMKSKVHHLGEKMALVPPVEGDEHGNSMQRSAHRQDASTMPE